MLKAEDLKIGDVVRLAGGSPRCVVEKITRKPGSIQDLITVTCWADRLGFVTGTVLASSLVWPRYSTAPAETSAETPPDEPR